MRLSVLIILVVAALVVACGCLWKGDAFVSFAPGKALPEPVPAPPAEASQGLSITNFLNFAAPGNLGAPLAIPFVNYSPCDDRLIAGNHSRM